MVDGVLSPAPGTNSPFSYIRTILFPRLAYFSTLKIEAEESSVTLASTRLHGVISQKTTIVTTLRNFKSHIQITVIKWVSDHRPSSHTAWAVPLFLTENKVNI
jgi:predicted DNA-binding ribbon-helix-helix protein